MLTSLLLCWSTLVANVSANPAPIAADNNAESSQSQSSSTQAHTDDKAQEDEAQLTKAQLAQINNLYQQPASSSALEALAQQLNLQADTRGQFLQQRHLAVLKKPLQSQGRFIFSPSQGLVWQQLKPFNSLMVLKDQQLTQQNSQGKVQQLSSAASGNPIAQQLPRLLQAIMAGDINALSADFRLFMPTETTGSVWQFGLQAKDPQVHAAMGNITLSGDKHIRTLIMTSQQTDISDYTYIQFTNTEQGPLSNSELALFSLSSGLAQ
ncbi:outer membrane lipoprotein carrier protein LolA [Shewanella litoralis]|uniref:outer membrane lipoprotein carrier protein LolA n=1 Tax=Shewanella litoralis TaxID=2282700 RepID=UPI0013567C3F|nr:outer membrane lipoprotein carrier protein LolA [Shewanella litoralis]